MGSSYRLPVNIESLSNVKYRTDKIILNPRVFDTASGCTQRYKLSHQLKHRLYTVTFKEGCFSRQSTYNRPRDSAIRDRGCEESYIHSRLTSSGSFVLNRFWPQLAPPSELSLQTRLPEMINKWTLRSMPIYPGLNTFQRSIQLKDLQQNHLSFTKVSPATGVSTKWMFN